MLRGLTYARTDGGRIYVRSEARSTMVSYTQETPEKLEAGGVLLGRHLLSSNDIVIDAITAPQPGDHRSRRRFFRSQRAHQALIDRAWWDSAGTCTYLGEWHTHPEQVPTPSLVDQVDWRRKLFADRFSDNLFFVIVGLAEIRVWQGGYRTLQLYQLERVD